ncbi:hypothetical protein BA6E_11235 [Bacteroidales bacterium 6E]|nr:hypothetical protein BA6E_11235 [Bacteroidales bacterium 6E]
MEKEYVKTATEENEYQPLFKAPSRLSRIYEEIRNENPELDEIVSLRIANTVLSREDDILSLNPSS